MSAHQALMMGYANPMIVVDSADFDGTNDYMTRGAGLTGAADSKTGIFSCWCRIDGGDGTTRRLFADGTTLGGGTARIQANISATNTIDVLCLTGAGATIISFVTTGTYLAGAQWLHILASWDGATGLGTMHINDVENNSSDIVNDITIVYIKADWAVGALCNGTTKFNGCMAELYFAPGQYLDFSLVHNRRKFISASGKPVHLGTTGALPTGTAPLVYQHLADAEAVANFATNRGTGGDFTITGTLATGSTSPSD